VVTVCGDRGSGGGLIAVEQRSGLYDGSSCRMRALSGPATLAGRVGGLMVCAKPGRCGRVAEDRPRRLAERNPVAEELAELVSVNAISANICPMFDAGVGANWRRALIAARPRCAQLALRKMVKSCW
jgi:hypothetical protein